jgi:hypothetical protein
MLGTLFATVPWVAGAETGMVLVNADGDTLYSVFCELVFNAPK